MKIQGHYKENGFMVITVVYHGFFRRLFKMKPVVEKFIESDRQFRFGEWGIVWLEYPSFRRYGRFEELDTYYLAIRHRDELRG